jgi:glutathionylspermidine synthase
VQRETVKPRPDWRRRCEEVGFNWHSMGGVYWDESACYAFDAGQIDRLEEVTAELHAMCLQVAAEVVRTRRFADFAIPDALHDLVAESWRNAEPSLFGRFDLSWDGRGEPKLLEYNADTPTALPEASVVQWHWLEQVKTDRDQFNSLHEKLIERWKSFPRNRVHFACVRESEEDLGNVEYLRDCALQAGLDARQIYIEDLGWDGKRFVDLEDEPLESLFKLYPWEWLAREEFGAHLLLRPARMIEPAWKMLLSNKALLVALWHLYPGHANLLPAYFDEQGFPGEYVKKPLLAREGANVTIRSGNVEMTEPGQYGAEGYIYQGLAKLPEFGGRYPVIGSWIVGDEPAGIGIREDDGPITRNASRFVPHYFT